MTELHKRPQAIALVMIVSACASACSSTKTATPTAAPAILQPAAQSSTAANTPTERFQSALDHLQNGQPQLADSELHDYLKDVPGNKSAHNLIAQIETPLDRLYPSDNFDVTLAQDESLSSLAKTYLGDPLSFYGLARYNGIGVPSKVNAGQTIKIPKTAEAIAAQKAKSASAKPAEEQSAIAVAPAPKPAENPHKIAEREYKKGMIAFQKQDLDGAIAAWNKVLAIDPDYKDAQLNRAQALRLKENLKKLQH